MYRLQQTLADPDIRLGGNINADIWPGGNLICFPVSHVNFFVGRGAKVYSQTGWVNMAGLAFWIRH